MIVTALLPVWASCLSSHAKDLLYIGTYGFPTWNHVCAPPKRHYFREFFLLVNLLPDTCFLNHRASQLARKSPKEVYEKADENRDASKSVGAKMLPVRKTLSAPPRENSSAVHGGPLHWTLPIRKQCPFPPLCLRPPCLLSFRVLSVCMTFSGEIGQNTPLNMDLDDITISQRFTLPSLWSNKGHSKVAVTDQQSSKQRRALLFVRT